MIIRARLGVWVVRIHGGPVILLGEQLLDLPVVHPSSNRELEVFPGDRVPELQHISESAATKPGRSIICEGVVG